LTGCEFRSLAVLDYHELSRFSRATDPRLQKTDLKRGGPWSP